MLLIVSYPHLPTTSIFPFTPLPETKKCATIAVLTFKLHVYKAWRIFTCHELFTLLVFFFVGLFWNLDVKILEENCLNQQLRDASSHSIFIWFRNAKTWKLSEWSPPKKKLKNKSKEAFFVNTEKKTKIHFKSWENGGKKLFSREGTRNTARIS